MDFRALGFVIGPSGFGGVRSQDPRTARGVRLRVLVMVEGSVMSAMVMVVEPEIRRQ